MREHHKYLLTALIAAFLALAPHLSAADPGEVRTPDAIHMSAGLADSEGRPVTGDVSVRIFIYDYATEGMSGDLDDAHLVYAEDHGEVVVARGSLNLAIGEGEALGPFSGSPLPLKALAESSALYVEFEIEGESLAPRKRMGFAKSSYGAAYARYAGELAGDFSVTTGSFPEDLSAAKIDCSASALNAARFSSIPSSRISGALPKSTMPSSIPLSKLGGGTLAAARLPNVPASSIQTGQFGAGVVPASVLSSAEVGVSGGVVASGGSVGGGMAGDCHCMAALHSTTGGGAEGMNVVDIGMDPAGGPVTCNMSFEEGGVFKKDTPECAPYPANQNECSGYCATWCADNCVPASPFGTTCTPTELTTCQGNCTGACWTCFVAGNVSLPCNVSSLCVCIN